MALNYKGTIAALPSSGVSLYDAYYVTGTGYRYCSVLSGTSATWSSYTPVKVIDELALNKTYEGSGAPTTTSNAVQFPDKLDTGSFYLDGSNGDVYAYIDPTGWVKW